MMKLLYFGATLRPLLGPLVSQNGSRSGAATGAAKSLFIGNRAIANNGTGKFSLLASEISQGSNSRSYSTSFYTRLTADQLWKGVTSVSNQGKKRGRGRGAGRKMAKDLNKGQVLGMGRINMVWPGLNAPVVKGKEFVEQKSLPPDQEYLTKLLKVRNEMDTYRKTKIHPLDRGWSGTRMGGKWIGPPDPVNGETFQGFETKILMVKNTFCMKANTGKTRRVKALTVTGNKNGLAGFAVGKSKEARVSLKKSKNKAAQRLVNVDLFEGHTILHDFNSRYGQTKVYAYKKPQGYGIVAHRCIKAICNVVGIKDIYCKVEGPQKNYLHVTKAFFVGLFNQKGFQQMADEKRLHVVEIKEERDWYPTVMASPSDGQVRTHKDIDADEITDFRLYLNEGKVINIKPNKMPNYVRTEGYLKFLQGWHYRRSKQAVRVYLKAKYGAVESFLTLREKEERAQRKAALVSEEPIEKETESRTQ